MEADSLLMATELRLGLPGTDDQKPQKTSASPPATPRGKKRTIDAFEDTTADQADKSDDVEAAPPAAKAQVVGWPPVRSTYRTRCIQAAATKSKANKPEDASSNNTTPSAAPTATSANGGSFVKVSMDGAPYLRKIDMRMYKGYRELREALEAMFVCFSGAADGAASANPSEYAITYEDKDGDLMLVGDVPFDMFSGTCKKLRIIKRSEATGLGSK